MKNMRRDTLMLCAVAFFALGCLFDHLTTGYGLSFPAFGETNPLVATLAEMGIWHEIEMLMITAGVGYGLYCLNSMTGDPAISLGVLAFSGLIRFSAGFQNLTAILQIVS
jgi:hypothetical protein